MSSSRSGSRPAIFMRADTASEPSPLATTGLTRAYRGGKGVFDITLKLAAGEVMGLMGPNGAAAARGHARPASAFRQDDRLSKCLVLRPPVRARGSARPRPP